MKKMIYFMFALLIMSATSMNAQVAISTNKPNLEPHPGAILDLGQVTGKNLGLLLPQVTLNSTTDKNAIQGNDPADGLMVYNPGTAGLAAGVYVWYDDQWWSTQCSSVNTADQLVISPAKYEFSDAAGYSSSPTAQFVVFNLTNSPITVPASVTGSFTAPTSVGPIAALDIAFVPVTANAGLATSPTPYEGVLTVGEGANARTAAISFTVTKPAPTITFGNITKKTSETIAFVPTTVTTNSLGKQTFSVVSGSDIVTAVDNNAKLQITGIPGTAQIRVSIAETDDYASATAVAVLTVPDCPGDIVGQVCWAASNLGSMNSPNGDKACRDLDNGWRLPTIDELISRWNELGSLGMGGSVYYSSTFAFGPDFYRTFDFQNGTASQSFNLNLIRCVRDM